MILGVAGLVTGDWRTIDSSTLQRAADLGFKTVQIRADDPSGATDAEIGRVSALYKEFGFPMAQSVGNYGGGLCSADEAERSSTVTFLEDMVRFSAKLGCPNTYFRPGSMNTSGPWKPHPDNRSEVVFDRLIDSGKRACRVAESEGVDLAIEGGVVSPLHSAQRVKDLIDAVGSPALKFNMDPVNFVGSIEQAYDNTSLLNEFYELLPDRILGAHAKDFTLVESLLPRFEETIIGQPESMLDQATFLRGMQVACPDAHILIEHLPDDKIPLAAEGLKREAELAGINWD
jgi:sugar phosphate isomerase/epimerase